MAWIDRRDNGKVYQNGSSKIDVGLTADQATEALGAAVAGWYNIGYMAGGTVGRETNAQREQDESGDTIATVASNDDFVIQNTTKQTDAVTLRLLEWLETNEVPVRYILPTPDPDVVQVHYHPAMSKDVDGNGISTGQGVRQQQFTLRGKKALRAFDDVAADQSDWAGTDVEDAMDTVFAAA